ncbi:hypothetical protein PRZ48_014735 [Zasmidium cellare]|uniref:D-xylulose reductase n=1 Tax=Zasmidium cellare TaxID=395010 RepID=A0ABR0DZ49_ZASCE|nr:hypothetical protein PRZ48_014735 [Zasmidium cellare]
MLFGPQEARFGKRPAPQIEDPYEVIVSISYVGVCGSDHKVSRMQVHLWMHGQRDPDGLPFVMGHEASGIVHTIGDLVTNVKPGDRVAIEPGFPCRRCNLCKSGKYNICPSVQFAAHPPTHGTLVRLFKIPGDFVYRIPDHVSLKEAVLVEPLSVAVHANRIGQTAPGKKILVLGSGTIGLLVAAVAKAFGVDAIYVADINPKKLETSRSLLGRQTFTPSLSSTPEQNDETFKSKADLSRGVDIVLECTGVESSAQTGVHALAPGGIFVQVGMGKEVQALPILAVCEKEIVVKGTFRYASGDYELALGLLASGKVDVKPLISEIVPFEKASEAWELTRRGEGIKNLIEMVPE